MRYFSDFFLCATFKLLAMLFATFNFSVMQALALIIRSIFFVVSGHTLPYCVSI